MAGLLPNGLSTLHYPGCGCPPGWNADVVDGQYRPADLVDALLQRAFRAYQQGGLTATRKLRVAYMLPHHNITGGMKCLVEHIRLLRERGHTTIAVHRSDTATQAMPPWSQQQADVDVVCRLHQRLADVYPAQQIDVCVVGIFHQVAELLMGVPAPVMYWEQGHEWVFGDDIRFQEAHNYRKQDQLFHMVMHLPCALVAVSEAVQAILKAEFGRASLIIPNGIDCHRFTPGARSNRQPSKTIHCTPRGLAPPARAGERSVLLVGNPALPLKAFPVALAALAAVNQVIPIRVTWVCQVEPTAAQLPGLPACGLTIDLYISPPQNDLAALYRGHDVLLFTSRYEAWGMPVMEGMASGLAVVATRCLGVATFAHHAHNCLLADPGDVAGLAQGVLQVLGDETLRTRLALAARHTALRFTPEDIADRLEAVLYSLTAVSSEVLSLRQPALSQLQLATAWASTACAKVSDQQRLQQQQQHEQLSRALSARTSGQLSSGQLSAGHSPQHSHSPLHAPSRRRSSVDGDLSPHVLSPLSGRRGSDSVSQELAVQQLAYAARDDRPSASQQLYMKPREQPQPYHQPRHQPGRIQELQSSYQQLHIGSGSGSTVDPQRRVPSRAELPGASQDREGALDTTHTAATASSQQPPQNPQPSSQEQHHNPYILHQHTQSQQHQQQQQQQQQEQPLSVQQQAQTSQQSQPPQQDSVLPQQQQQSLEPRRRSGRLQAAASGA
mmetsp:Transcript_6975/g.20372  ORF Transcript_6975/g.20372 Transcript_6975/m.20372 type:complete len:726 (+) Transcript_6975:386-2563(+)